MGKMDFIWVIFLAWGVLSLALFLAQALITRRFFKKVEHTLGLKFKRNRVKNALDKKDFAMVSFDEKNDTFYWNGRFDGSQAFYSFNAETGYASIKLVKDDHTLSIYRYMRSISESRITSMIPYKMEINGRTIYNTSLLKESGEKKLIYEILKGYFKNGVKRDAEFLSEETQESIDALIFGYHTTKRFLAYLKKTYPDFYSEIESYERRSIKKSISVFQPVEKSEDELEIEAKKAIFEEDYERAARIRDQIRKMKQS